MCSSRTSGWNAPASVRASLMLSAGPAKSSTTGPVTSASVKAITTDPVTGVRRAGHGEVQPVLDVLQPLRPFLGQRRRHTGSDRVLGVGMAGGKRHGEENRDRSEMSAGHASRLSAEPGSSCAEPCHGGAAVG